jgi:ribulose-phosphate 3-epimerase
VNRGDRLRELTPVLSVGLLSGDLLNLDHELRTLAGAGVRVIHIDVMDGVFCPSLTVGAAFVAAIPDAFIKDVHLMIENPLEKVDQFLEAGADVLSFQLEGTRHPHRLLQSLAGSGVIRGVALTPATPVMSISPLLDELDFVLVLGVNPGWGGQALIDTTRLRVAEARRLAPSALVGVDGGINASNIAEVARFGADVVVSGAAIFDGDVAENSALFASTLQAVPAPSMPGR